MTKRRGRSKSVQQEEGSGNTKRTKRIHWSKLQCVPTLLQPRGRGSPHASETQHRREGEHEVRAEWWVRRADETAMHHSGVDKRLPSRGTKIGTYPRLRVLLQSVCRTAEANAPGTGGLLRFVGTVTPRLFAMFWANRFGSLGCPLLRKDSYALLFRGTWKGTSTIGVFSGLLSLCLRRGHGDVMCWFDVESD